MTDAPQKYTWSTTGMLPVVSAYGGGWYSADDVDSRIDAQAAEITALRAKLADWQCSQNYRYIGRDGKSVLARDLEDRAEAAEAKLAETDILIERSWLIGRIAAIHWCVGGAREIVEYATKAVPVPDDLVARVRGGGGDSTGLSALDFATTTQADYQEFFKVSGGE